MQQSVDKQKCAMMSTHSNDLPVDTLKSGTLLCVLWTLVFFHKKDETKKNRAHHDGLEPPSFNLTIVQVDVLAAELISRYE